MPSFRKSTNQTIFWREERSRRHRRWLNQNELKFPRLLRGSMGSMAGWPKVVCPDPKAGNDRIARCAPVWLTVAMTEMRRSAAKFHACGLRLQAAPDESGEKNEGAAKSAYI